MDREAAIRLGVAASGVAPAGARALRDHGGSWTAAAREAARRDRVPPRLRDAFARAEADGERVAERCRARGIRVVGRRESGWPEALEALTDAPEFLFVRGDLRRLAEPLVAMVGTRECSAAGADWTRRTARQLAEAGWGTVSGLARGIDAAAHAGTLEGQGDTVAVLGCGVDVVYPPEHRSLMERIVDQGAVVSEFAPGVEPRAHHFPRRNRILAALSRAVVVVECRRRSGALITARHGLEMGREVFTVPGWPGSPLSDGPLVLLRDGARPVRNAADLVEDLGGTWGGPQPSPEEVATLDALRGGAGSAEDVAGTLGIRTEDARERLARLELLGLAGPGTPRG